MNTVREQTNDVIKHRMDQNQSTWRTQNRTHDVKAGLMGNCDKPALFTNSLWLCPNAVFTLSQKHSLYIRVLKYFSSPSSFFLSLGEHLRMCPQGYTCCTSQIEESLSNLSRKEFEDQVKESGQALQVSLNSQYKSFDGKLSVSLACSWGVLKLIFMT